MTDLGRARCAYLLLAICIQCENVTKAKTTIFIIKILLKNYLIQNLFIFPIWAVTFVPWIFLFIISIFYISSDRDFNFDQRTWPARDKLHFHHLSYSRWSEYYYAAIFMASGGRPLEQLCSHDSRRDSTSISGKAPPAISDMNMSPECHPVFSHEKTGWHSSDIFSSLSWYIMHTLPLLHTHASSDMPMQVVCGGQLSTGSARAHEQLRAPAAVTRCAHAAATVCWSPLSPPSCC